MSNKAMARKQGGLISHGGSHRVAERISALESHLDERINGLESRFDAMEKAVW